ncbi:energy-coupling factor ABC transporter ATP-binding protein [Caniella muris]|uniref:energy-coupling factor ABC transporter ATP-binding protein n=1 Tax=Caniella muris TaxID=2941502 RepID=UPI00203E3B7D|nr:ATP-binding cassette domain-containing protein [Caniella muris]
MSLAARSLTFRYPDAPSPAVDGVDLEARDGRVTCLLGATGSGKSTLLRAMAGLVAPTGGEAHVDGTPTWVRRGVLGRPRRRPGLPRAVGYVMQRPERQLFAATVAEDAAFGPRNLGATDAEAAEAAEAALGFLGIRHLAGRSPFELSGGQQRLAAIAGVLAMDPANLVLDEPMAALDPEGRAIVRDAVARLASRRGAVLLVTHDMDDAASLAASVAVLDRGRVALSGTPEEVFSRAGELRRLGLGLPSALEAAHLLRERRGVDVGEPLTLDALADALAALARGPREGA